MSAGPRVNLSTRSRGFVMSYILVGLAILSLTAMVFARMANQTAESKRMVDVRDEVVSQARLIRAKIISCAVLFPAGDPTTNDTLMATNATGVAVASLTCPGDPSGTPSIWKPSDGVYAPRSITGLSGWTFIHSGSTASTISITALSGGNAITAALNNAALKFGAQGHAVGASLVVDITN